MQPRGAGAQGRLLLESRERGVETRGIGRRALELREFRSHRELEVVEHGELVVLLGRHERVDRDHGAHLAEPAQPRGPIDGGCVIGCDGLEIQQLCVTVRGELEQRLDGFAVRVAQVNRIAVERDPPECDAGGNEHDCRDREHGARVPVERHEDPRVEHGSGALDVQRRRELRHERGQQRRGHEKTEEHAGARDPTELRDSLKLRRDERVEARGRRESGQHERGAHAAHRLEKRRLGRVALRDELAVTQEHVDHVVAAEADVEHDERNRQQIQVTDRRGGERGRVRQAGEQRDQRDREQPPRAQRDKEHAANEKHRREAADAGGGAHARELFVLHRDAAAEPHGDRPGLGRVQACDDRADSGDCRGGGLDLAEVDGRLEHDDPTRARGGRAAEQVAPRERLGRARARVLEHSRELRVERRGRRGVGGGRRRGWLERARRDVEHGRAVEARVQETQQRLRGRELVRELLEPGSRQVQEPVAREELALALEKDGVVEIRLAAQLGEQLRGELVGARGRFRVDDDEQVAVAYRERLAVLVEVLPPRQRGRDHVRRVGVHAEVVRGVPERGYGRREQHDDRDLAPAQNPADDAHEAIPDPVGEP